MNHKRLALIIHVASSGRISSDPSTDILHAACSLCLPLGPSLPLPMLELILWLHPEQVLKRDERNNIPLHYALRPIQMLSTYTDGCTSSDDWKFFVAKLLDLAPESARIRDHKNRLPLNVALDPEHDRSLSLFQNRAYSLSAREEVIARLVDLFPESVDIRDPVTKLYPFMLAAASHTVDLDSVFFLLRRSPSRCSNDEQ